MKGERRKQRGTENKVERWRQREAERQREPHNGERQKTEMERE